MPYGKTKGSAFEREICRDITKAFSVLGIKTQDAYRSILSGGHKDSFGDISMSSKLARMFPYGPECKTYKSIDLNLLYIPWRKMSKASWFKKWWKQTLAGAEKCKRGPLLIFKANQKQILCAVSLSAAEQFEKARLVNSMRSLPHMVLFHREEEIWVCNWQSFLLACVESEKFRKHNKKDKHL